MAHRNRLLATLTGLGFGLAAGLSSLAPAAEPLESEPLPIVSAPPAARTSSEADQSFEQFCGVWMGKLRSRERANLAQAKPHRNGAAYVIEYTGYGGAPLRCEAKPTGVKSNPFIGKLVYSELVYRRQGSTGEQARGSAGELVSEIEVMEIFRFDGKRWVY